MSLNGSKKFVRCTLLDYLSPFDSISGSFLLLQLKKIGCFRKVLAYFPNRTQYTRMGGEKSKPLVSLPNTIQCVVLYPYPFTTNIRDLLTNSSCHLIKYVHDAVFCHVFSSNKVSKIFQQLAFYVRCKYQPRYSECLPSLSLSISLPIGIVIHQFRNTYQIWFHQLSRGYCWQKSEVNFSRLCPDKEPLMTVISDQKASALSVCIPVCLANFSLKFCCYFCRFALELL